MVLVNCYSQATAGCSALTLVTPLIRSQPCGAEKHRVESVLHFQWPGAVCLFVYRKLNLIRRYPNQNLPYQYKTAGFHRTNISLKSYIYPEPLPQSGYTVGCMHTVHLTKSVLCELHSLKCTLCSLKYASCAVQCTVYSFSGMR